MGLSNKLSSESGSFSHHHNPHRFLQSEVLRLYFPTQNPVLHSLSFSPVVPPILSVCRYGTAWLASRHLVCPRHPGFLSLCLLPVWMSVSSTPWLSGFHTVQFSGNSGCFFVFILVLILLLVVQGSEAYLSMPPSWPEGQHFLLD